MMCTNSQQFLYPELLRLQDALDVEINPDVEEDPYWLCLLLLYILVDNFVLELHELKQSDDPDRYLASCREMSPEEYFRKIKKLIPVYIDMDDYKKRTGRDFFIGHSASELIYSFYAFRPSLLKRQYENVRHDIRRQPFFKKYWMPAGTGIVIGFLLGFFTCVIWS